MKIAVCPRDSKHTSFITTAHEAHDWLVDGHGNFIEDKGCFEVTHKPDVDNTWTCNICGEIAEWRDE